MMEYTPVNPLRLHPSTCEKVKLQYFDFHDCYPSITAYQQIWNTLQTCGPDIHTAIASIQLAARQIIADMSRYPEDAWELRQQLAYVEEFAEIVQETSAKLHNGEPAKRANIEALNRLFAESEQREAERRQRWIAEEAAGDAYFGAPGAYERIREEMYAELDMKKHEALRERIRAFQVAYRQGQQPAQPQTEPVQAGLWEVAV